jgi:tetratricopeptide (TPR) repeat protein
MLAAIAREPEQACAYYHQALVVLEIAEDLEKTHTSDILEELAWLERDEGNLDTAIEYLEQAVEMWRQNGRDDLLLGAWHVFETLADFYEDAGRIDDAESTFLTMLAIYHSEAKTSQESLPFGGLLERITQFYLRQNHGEKARTFLQEQYSLLPQNPDRVEHYTLSRLATLLGWIYMLQEDIEMAADLFSQALEYYEQSVIAQASERVRQDIARVPILLDLVYVALKQGKCELADTRFAEVKVILNKAEMFTHYVEHLQEEMREFQEVDLSKDWEIQRRHAHADVLRQYAQ